MNRKWYRALGIIAASIIVASCEVQTIAPPSGPAATEGARATLTARLNIWSTTEDVDATSTAQAQDQVDEQPEAAIAIQAEPIAAEAPPEVIIGRTGNGEFAAMAINQRNEQLVAITETDDDGNILAVIGGVWNSPDDDTIVFFNGEDGLPAQSVIGEYVFLYNNWGADSVDATLILADGSTVDFEAVPVDVDLISSIRAQSQPNGGGKLAALAYQTTCESVTEIILYVEQVVTTTACIATFAASSVPTLGNGALDMCTAETIAVPMTLDVVSYYACEAGDLSLATNESSPPFESKVLDSAQRSVGNAEDILESRGVEAEPIPYGGAFIWPDRFDTDRKHREDQNADALARLAALLAAASGLLFAMVSIRNLIFGARPNSVEWSHHAAFDATNPPHRYV